MNKIICILVVVLSISFVYAGPSANPLPVSQASLQQMDVEVSDMTQRWQVNLTFLFKIDIKIGIKIFVL